MGSDSGLCRHSSLIPCTHECYDFILHIGRRRAHSSIFAATALLATATPSRLRHRPVPISQSTQGPPPTKPASHSPSANTSRCKLAILPPTQPAHGESTKSPLRSANATNAGALRHGMERSNGVRRDSALTPQPRAAIDQQPPFASKPAECWNRRPR